MADENPNPLEPVAPANYTPVPPAPVPPAFNQGFFEPVPPAYSPVPPAGYDPAAYAPVPPAGYDPSAYQPVPPAGYGYEPIPPSYESAHPQQNLPPITPMAPAAGDTGHRPATGGRRPASKNAARAGGARSTPYRRPKPVESGLSVMSVLMGLLGIVMLVGSVYALLPKSLTHIDGYPTDPLNKKEPKNLLAIGQKILESRTEDAVFTEREVNDYINFRLQGEQQGALGGFMTVKGVYVDLRPNEAEIFVERSFPLIGSTTISTVVESYFNETKHQQIWKTGGGSIGRFNFPKGRSLQPVLNLFLRMAKVGSEEMQVMDYMANVKIEEGKLTLDSAL